VLEVAVYPVPSDVGEDEVMVAISSKNNELKPENIIDYCLNNMPTYWIPNYIRFLNSLPKTPTGRIEKYKLKNEGITKDTYNMSEHIKNRLKK